MKQKQDRLSRLEAQARPVVDAKRDAQFNFLRHIAQSNPGLASGTPTQRQATENNAVGIVMGEMVRRLDAGKLPEDMAHTLKGLLEYERGRQTVIDDNSQEEDWGDE